MSETSKMGLFGSKEGNASSNSGQLSKDESPERYAPYSVDSDSETYDTEALSIMDINDIIGVQTEPVSDSTLESEIAALSEIITDTNAPETTHEAPADKNKNNSTVTENVKPSECTTHENKVEPSDKNLSIKSCENLNLIVSESSVKMDSNFKEVKSDANKWSSSIADDHPLESRENTKENESKCSKDITAISKSLQLIGEAYDSDDSEYSDSDEMQIGEMPKIVFSCKPFVEKQTCTVPVEDNCEIECKNVDEPTAVVKDNVTIQMENKIEERHGLIEESTKNSNLTDNISKIEVDASSNDEYQNSTEIIMNDVPNLTNIHSDESAKVADETTLQPQSTNCISDTTPVIDAMVTLSDNHSDKIEKFDNATTIEIEENREKVMSINQDDIERIEIKVSEDEPDNGEKICPISPSKCASESREKLNTNVSVEDANKIHECDSTESDKFEKSTVLVAQTTECSINELNAESQLSNIKTSLLEHQKTEVDLGNTNEINSAEEIQEKICDSTVAENQLISTSKINDIVDNIATEKFPPSDSQEIIPDDRETVKIVMEQEDVSKDDEQLLSIEKNIDTNDQSVEENEEFSEVKSLESEENKIADEDKVPESPSENKQIDENTDSSVEFMDALSPAQFETLNAMEIAKNEKLQVDVGEKINNETDNEREFLDTVEEIKGEQEISNNTEICPDQLSLDEKSIETTKNQAPDSESYKSNEILVEEKSEKEEEKVAEIVQESSTSIDTEIKKIHDEIEELPKELLSINSSKSPSISESTEQLASLPTVVLDSEEVQCDESNEIESLKNLKIITNTEKVDEPFVKKDEILPKNHEPDVSSELIKENSDVFDAKSIEENQEIQNKDTPFVAPILLSKDIASTANKIIDDSKQNLLLQSDELLENSLENPISMHTDDLQDEILDLNITPNIVDAEMKNNESPIKNVVEDISKDIDTIDKVSTVELLQPECELVTDNKTDNFLEKVIGELHEPENKVIDTDLKIENEPIINKITSVNIEDEVENKTELNKEKVEEDLPVDKNNKKSKLDIPYTLTQEEKLEIPHDIQNDGLTVESTIEVLLPTNKKISDLAGELLTHTEQDKLEAGLDRESLIEEFRVHVEQYELETAVTSESTIEELPTHTEQDKLEVDFKRESLIEELRAHAEQYELDTSVNVKSSFEELEVEAEKYKLDAALNVESNFEELETEAEKFELQTAVKFLQESEDNEIESPVILSPKLIEEIVDEINQSENSPTTYSANQEICENSSDLVIGHDTITTESIDISEAEIINEAVKLESERKFNEESNRPCISQSIITEEKETSSNDDYKSKNEIVKEKIKEFGIAINDSQITATHNIFPVKSSIIPKTSILEERLKEPPKIEIPIVDPLRLCDMPTTPKTSLLIPRDSRMSNYQKMMDSPKSSIEKSSRDEIKGTDMSRKDCDKYDIENVGSPRIILKIAKSALADCVEPRSPKSPKIRSATNSPNPEDSPGQKLGKIKLKLSKGGHPSIIPNDNPEELAMQWYTEGSSSLSPLGMKIKLSKSGDASIIQHELKETPKHMLAGSPKRTESPLGMKIKLSKSGDASIVQPDKSEDTMNRETKIKDKSESSQDVVRRSDSPLGMKIKLLTTGDASIVSSEYDECKDMKDSKNKEKIETHQDNQQKRLDSHVGMKIKLSKKGGASILSTNDNKDKIEMPKSPRRTESPLGMKIKLSKTGDASIIHSDEQTSTSSHESCLIKDNESMSITTKRSESSIGMKIKLSRDGDATIVHSEKIDDEQQQDLKRTDSTIGMKIKLSKTGDASIVQSQTIEDYEERSDIKIHKPSDTTAIESMKIRLSKTGHGTIVVNENDTSQKSKEFIETHQIFSQKREQLVNRSEVTIEPIQLSKKSEQSGEISLKRKDSVTLSPIETKKSKIDTKLSQMLPEVTIQPVTSRDQKPINFEQSNTSAISRQQINVINQEISITQLKPNNPGELSVNEKLRKMLTKSQTNPSEECQIIERRPELIIVNENSNSSQDIMIIDEVPPLRVPIPDAKTPKKRGRPRRSAVSIQFQQPNIQIPSDPLALDTTSPQSMNNSMEPKENERPRRTCRSQKSYAPPKRGRGRGRGKRKFDKIEMSVCKRARLEQNHPVMKDCSTALINLDDTIPDEIPNDSSELYKALRQPLKSSRMDMLTQNPIACTVALKNRVDSLLDPALMARLEESRNSESSLSSKINQVQTISDQLKKDSKNVFDTPDHQNWLTPSSKKYMEVNRNDGISTVQVIDEDTRMSAESFSRSQTPARNILVNTAETSINEESQGSVLSTATTESEKVKVKNRRMEISFDPDEGPFTVDKIAEYEWPIDRKGETFMIQEQISQYLGVKSFKRKYPDLKRRMVDMEERNYLRENGLVSEAMCDMGLTAICSSEVLDIMCSDFPDQYEEYRKHMREKQIKEHSKKQKELSAAATAEKNRIDLAEMAVQSALSWNVNLNKARRESRRCSLDLQTFTIHVPKKLQKIEDKSKISHYPVALIPGQYTDYYREYTPAELRYYPLNTVLYGPMRPNERKFDSQSEGSQSDSDTDTSSDDSSCSSSEGTQDTEESQSTMDDVDMELSNQKDKLLKCKMCLKHLNKSNKTEVLIQCGTCSGHVHPSCIDLTLDMVPHIQAYAWQCTDCKTCVQCHDPADEDKMLFCDMCDRGYHIYCVGLRRVPQGRWHCQECAICASCGSREAGGVNADRNSVALWQHEYKKGDKNTRIYVSTLCVPCSKLCGEQGSDNRPEKLPMRSLYPESAANS